MRTTLAALLHRGLRPRVLVALIAAVLALGLAYGVAASLASSASPAPGKVILRVGWTDDPDNLNPFIGIANSSFEIWHLNYDLLTGYRASDLSPAPELAVSWSYRNGGRTWIFHLRHNVTWQDGMPFTAQDVAFTFNYIIQNQMSAFTSYTEYIRNVRVLDDHTVQFDCTRPKANMLGMWVPILPRHIWKNVSPKAAANTFQNKPPIIGTGPFEVVDVKKSNYVRLVANKGYWRGAPRIDGILFETFQTADAMTQAMQTGGLDVALEVPAVSLPILSHAAGVKAISFPLKGFAELDINSSVASSSTGDPVLRDPAFRDALQYAIDKQAIARVAWQGLATPATSLDASGFYSPKLDYHWQPPTNEAYTFDLAKAAAAMDAAGYKLSATGARLDKRGRPIVLRFFSSSSSIEAQKAAKLICGWLSQIGIKTSLQVMDEGSLDDHVWNTKNGVYAPDFDLVTWGEWTGDVDPNWIFSIFTSQQVGNWNPCGWSSAAYDALYRQQQVTMDPQRRKEIFWKLQEILYKQSPVIFLVYPRRAEAYNTDRFSGWVPVPEHGGGVIFETDNIDSYLVIHPPAASEAASGSHATGWVAAVVVAVAVVVLAFVFVRRRGRRAAEEE